MRSAANSLPHAESRGAAEPAGSELAVVPRWRLLLGAALVAIGAAVSVGWFVFSTPASTGPVHLESRLLGGSDDEVIQAVHAALGAWAEFAVSGDLDVLNGHFHTDGPQYAQLRVEATVVRQSADGGPPYRFEVHQAALRHVSRRDAVIIIDTTLRRHHEADRRYRWLVQLRRQVDHGWTVWTVATADEEQRCDDRCHFAVCWPNSHSA